MAFDTVWHMTLNQRAVGSNPTAPTKTFRGLGDCPAAQAGTYPAVFPYIVAQRLGHPDAMLGLGVF